MLRNSLNGWSDTTYPRFLTRDHSDPEFRPLTLRVQPYHDNSIRYRWSSNAEAAGRVVVPSYFDIGGYEGDTFILVDERQPAKTYATA